MSGEGNVVVAEGQIPATADASEQDLASWGDFVPREEREKYFADERAKEAGRWGQAPAPQQSADAREEKPEAESQSNDDGGEEEFDDADIVVDEDGRARSKSTGQFVPRSAYLRVKEDSKATKQQLANVVSELIRMREREAIVREMAAAQNAQDEPVEQVVDPYDDPIGAQIQLAKRIQELEARLAETDQSFRARFEAQQMQLAAAQDMKAFAEKQPDFLDAYKFLSDQRHAELEALGVVNAAQRDEIIRREAREVVTRSLKDGVSAAERIYKLASARGYRAQQSAQTPAIDPKKVDNINKLNEARMAGVTLSKAGSSGDGANALNKAKLATMSEREFQATRHAYVAKHGQQAWYKLLGE